MKRFLSSTAIHKSKLSSAISSSEREILNRTSLGLYRIFSRIISLEAKKNEFILLQPSLSHLDYGQARMIDATKCMIWRDNEINNDDAIHNKILTFSKTWTEKEEDEEEEKVIGNFDELFGILHDEEDYDDDDEDQDDSYLPDVSLYVTPLDLKRAVRKEFLTTSTSTDELTKQDILNMQRFAIDSINLLEEQRRMWDRTSISVDNDRGIRVVATSRCIGISSSGHAGLKLPSEIKYRFAYKIRIENFNVCTSDENDDKTVQLLGRTWKILEDEDDDADNFGLLSLNQDKHKNDSSREVNVVAPTTGAVGHLPVIRPGEAFEYMSACELSTMNGTISGCFHMAVVDEDTKSGKVGDPVDAFDLPEEKHFEMKVLPVRLSAEEN